MTALYIFVNEVKSIRGIQLAWLALSIDPPELLQLRRTVPGATP